MGVKFENEEYDIQSDPFYQYAYYDESILQPPPRIENGSTLTIGRDSNAFTMIVDQHFNWFQKRMIKWCFGIKVRDYRQ